MANLLLLLLRCALFAWGLAVLGMAVGQVMFADAIYSEDPSPPSRAAQSAFATALGGYAAFLLLSPATLARWPLLSALAGAVWVMAVTFGSRPPRSREDLLMLVLFAVPPVLQTLLVLHRRRRAVAAAAR